MKQKEKQNGKRNQILASLTVERKKLAIAVLLVSVMVVMWVRVLAKKNQSELNGAMLAPQTATAEQAQPKIKAAELPQVKGRNDVLARDIFAGDKWEGSGAAANGATQRHVARKSVHENLSDMIETIGKELELEAIFSGKNPQASVSGMLVVPAGRLTVNHEGDQYEFKVLAINDNEVVLECKGVQVKLSLPTESAN
jgi:hypothetical protein